MKMKICPQCEGKGSYWETSPIDNLFSELVYCRKCRQTGKIEDKSE